MTIATVVIFGLATWRVSSLLVGEDGPFYIFRKIREKFGIVHDDEGKPLQIPDHFLAQLLSCVWCASMWVGAGWLVFWLLSPDIAVKLAAAFSFSTLAILLDRYISG